MNHKERFEALMTGMPVDRVPLYFFGSWHETKQRWDKEGCPGITDYNTDPGPQVPGMDPDWEDGMWNCHGLVNIYPIGDVAPEIIEETESYYIEKNSLGDVVKHTKLGSSISHTIHHSLKPERESWERFKRFLNSKDPSRRPEGWQHKAKELGGHDRVLAFMGGSLYGWLRDFMGVEEVSMLMYDDEELFEEMLSYLTDHWIELFGPVLDEVKFDFVYFYEDCCGANGPLFSPSMYKKVFDKYYKKLISFYKSKGVKFALVDSDGRSDLLIPCWMESGFDIIFPVEIGVWNQSAEYLRKTFGKELKMMGGVDKHCIAKGEEEIRKTLLQIKPTVDEGGFLPIPDHRIPPECSYNDFLTYIKVFGEIFGRSDVI